MLSYLASSFLLYWFLFSWMFSCSPKSAQSFQHCFLTVWKHFQSSALSPISYDKSPFPCFSSYFHYPYANCFSFVYSQRKKDSLNGLCNGCSLCLEHSSSWSLCGWFFFFSDLCLKYPLKIFFDHPLWKRPLVQCHTHLVPFSAWLITITIRYFPSCLLSSSFC